MIVPTTYFATPVSTYREAGIATVIWANHNLRAAAAAMRYACDKIMTEESVASLEGEIASIADLFNLMDYQELEQAERLYLP